MNRVDALQSCLAAEHAALFGYGVLGGVLAGVPAGEPDLERAQSSYAVHRQLRDDLTVLISEAEAEPVAAAAVYDLPFTVRDRLGCRHLARLLEGRTATVYGLAIAATVDEDRAFTAAALRGSVLREVSWGADVVPFPAIPEL
ncbi:MAG: ferritin-like domain-containing protein [Nocardioidaceae bacterium]|nr:ferritin-like domain-containing protein [Nocardioidaceae bacterium]